MRIFFHSNGALADSPYFYYTMAYPPKGVFHYASSKTSGDVFLDMKTQRVYKMFAGLAKKLLDFAGKSAVNVSDVPNTPVKCDLVHAVNTIPNTTLPFVVELESFHSLFVGGSKDSSAINRIVTRLSVKNCKKIIFWTQNGYDNFFKLTGASGLMKKSIVLYPGVPLYVQNKIHRKPTIGFIGRNFYDKGGDIVLSTMKDFVKSGRANAIIVTDLNLLKDAAPNVFKEYKEITFKQLMPRAQLHKKIFPKIDVLLYPGYSDTFGFIFPEAMSHGIPIVTFDGCARREIVHHEHGGFVVWGKHNEWGYLLESPKQVELDDVKFLISVAITNIISDKKFNKKMADYNYNVVRSGQFSLYNRNKMLKKIYDEALV